MRLLLNIDVPGLETGIAFYEAAGNGFCLLRFNGGVYEAAK